MKTLSKTGAWLAVAMAVLVATPLIAQEEMPVQEEMPAPEPEPIMSAAAEAALDQALSGVSHEDTTLSARVYFFPSLQGGTLAMVGFEVGTDGLTYGVDTDTDPMATTPVEVARMELFGAVLADGTEVARFGDDFTIGQRGGASLSGVKSFGDTLAAGSYEFVWGVRDTIADVTATRRDTVEVPDLQSAGLTTSSVLLVQGQPMAAPGQFQPHTVYDGVRVLTVAFPDDLDRVLAAGTDSIMLTYIVSGAQFDAATQGFDLELAYSILDSEGELLWQAEPQTLNRPTVGQVIPLAQIEALAAGNDYTFEIGIKDLAAGTESTTRVPFRIAG